MFPYDRLAVWQRAHRLGVAILGDRTLDASAPARSVADQLRRAMVSVSANIAEGAGSSSHRAFARYLGIALASAHEAESLVRVAQDAGFMSGELGRAWIGELGEIRAMLFVLRRRVRNDPRAARSAGGPP